MGVILGIDIGGSSTKIVGLHENGTVIDMLRVKAEDPLTSLYGALGNFLATHSLKLTDIGHIALTGVGASYVDGDIYGVRTVKVEEFPSVGVGGLALSRKERAVVVSMGTGTSLLWAEKGGEIRHIIGSGIGGAFFIDRVYYDGVGYGAAYFGNTYIPDWQSPEPGAMTRVEEICSGLGIERRLRRPGYVPAGSRIMEMCGGCLLYTSPSPRDTR